MTTRGDGYAPVIDLARARARRAVIPRPAVAVAEATEDAA